MVIDETWMAVGASLEVQGQAQFNLVGDGFTPERAKLAAQAPAMARLFLTMLSREEKYADSREFDGMGTHHMLRAQLILRNAGVLPEIKGPFPIGNPVPSPGQCPKCGCRDGYHASTCLGAP